jgi:MFS family permease
MSTLIGVASAVVLVWLASQVGDDSTADYWALYALIAAGGLAMALSQLLGGWTKWGWPRVSGTVFLLGFLPALAVTTWVLGAGQPTENWLQEHVVDWSDSLGLDGVVEDLLDLAGPLAFLTGLTFGFTFDTSGPRTREVAEPEAAAVAPAERRTEVREHETPTEVTNGDRETPLTRHADTTERETERIRR